MNDIMKEIKGVTEDMHTELNIQGNNLKAIDANMDENREVVAKAQEKLSANL